MTEPQIRPEVVALLAGLNLDGTPDNWTHANGTPVTRDELRLAMTANFAELRAVLDYSRRVVDYASEQAAAFERLDQITGPHFARLGEDAVMADVTPMLTDAERAEVEELKALIAPDGWIVRPNN